MHLVAFLSGCLIWLPLMVWTFSLVGWMVTGDIDVLTGLIGVIVGFGLGFTAQSPPIPLLAPISLAIVLGTVCLYPVIQAMLNKRGLRGLEVEQLERAYNSLGQRPNNPSAQFRVAQHLWAIGMLGPARAIAERSIPQLSVQHFRDEHRLLQRWKATVIPADQFRPIECMGCNHPNQPGSLFCERCGEPFLLYRAQRRFRPTATARKLIAAWIAMVAVLVGIPAASVLPPLYTIAAILGLMAMAVAVIILAFRNSPETSGA